MRRLIIGLAIAAVAFSAIACSAGGGTGGTIEGTNWQLASYDVSGTSTDVPAGVVVDARFTAGQVAGFAGCNSYTGPATVSGSTIKIGPVASTLMLCEGPGGDVETAYLAALPSAATFTATADALTLYDSTGKSILVYAAGPSDPLVGAWTVTGYNNGNEGFVSPVEGSTITATFGADGQVAGSTGCNEYNGAYVLDGTSLTVGPLASTKKACDQALMDQESQFLAALQTPTTVEPSGATITLRDANGAMQVGLSR